MSPECIYRSKKEEGEGLLVLRSCKEWVQILAWLPEREHREDAANGFEGESAS